MIVPSHSTYFFFRFIALKLLVNFTKMINNAHMIAYKMIIILKIRHKDIALSIRLKLDIAHNLFS